MSLTGYHQKNRAFLERYSYLFRVDAERAVGADRKLWLSKPQLALTTADGILFPLKSLSDDEVSFFVARSTLVDSWRGLRKRLDRLHLVFRLGPSPGNS